MRFSILHISDLHRDLSDEINNKWLLDSLQNDFNQFDKQTPAISRPELCIVSGDLIYGVKAGIKDGGAEQRRQFVQAEEFLIGLADTFFDGDRNKVVILPGNHDVSYPDVMASAERIELPNQPEEKARLVAELFRPNSRLRWSWSELCFYRIADEERYLRRLEHFGEAYKHFYNGDRAYSLDPEQQFAVFDFPALGFCVAALNSCYNNDPLRRTGAFHPTALTSACRAIRQSVRDGWLIAAAWHHNLGGGPGADDYLDAQFLQLLIDAGVSLGLHGHQHLPECFDERYRIGPKPRKITVVSASTLCAEPRNLKPGVPRSYNIIEVDTESWTGRVHQRQMVNMLFSLPVWGPGHFTSTNSSSFDFELAKPLKERPVQMDTTLVLDEADRCIGNGLWSQAVELLKTVREAPLARPLLTKALIELADPQQTIDMIWPPQTSSEAITVGGAILEGGTKKQAENFVQLPIVRDNLDASVRHIAQKVQERRLR